VEFAVVDKTASLVDNEEGEDDPRQCQIGSEQIDLNTTVHIGRK
jgi:hypothetical protein